jgi:hypothetical protein
VNIEYVSRENRDVSLLFKTRKIFFKSQKNVKKYLIYFEKATKGYGPRQVVGLGLCLFAVISGVIAESAFLVNKRKVRTVFASNWELVFLVIASRNVFLFD